MLKYEPGEFFTTLLLLTHYRKCIIQYFVVDPNLNMVADEIKKIILTLGDFEFTKLKYNFVIILMILIELIRID